MKFKFLADLKVLTEHAAQVASREENRARSFCAGNGRLFSKMQTGVRNLNLRADFANREFACNAIHTAIARATDAVRELSGKWFIHKSCAEYKVNFPNEQLIKITYLYLGFIF